MCVRGFILALALLCVCPWAAAESVSYQGILTNAGGDSLLSGSYDFSFGIYSTETGGAPRWTETHNDVEVSNGVYSVLLGSSTALPDSIGPANWLQISVEGSALSPRLPITADFRALEAKQAQNADSVNHIGARFTPTANHLVPLAGNAKFSLAVLPNLIASVDSVFNHGGNIDLIAGPNISIVPNDSANTITFSAMSATYQPGRCIDITGNVIDNTMDIFGSSCIDVDFDAVNCEYDLSLNLDIEGDDCIDVNYDPQSCTYYIESLMQIFGGNCIIVTPSVEGCNWTISLDPDCIFGNVDSIFHSEVYARSVVITPDGTLGNAVGHLTADGKLELYGAGGDTLRLKPDGTMDVIQDGLRVAGIDSNGEVFAKSFMVIDPATGDTLAHILSDGSIEIKRDGETAIVDPHDGVMVIDSAGNGVGMFPDGTWQADQGGVRVAGLDHNGELYAKSFMVIDPATGDTLAHILSDGSIEIKRDGETAIVDPHDGVMVIDSAGNGVGMFPDGTWQADRGGVRVAGLDHNGELYAKSFMVIDPTTGDTIIHLTNDGQILVDGTPVGGEGETIVRNNGSARSEFGALGIATGTTDAQNIIAMSPDGTWLSIQDGEAVAGLDTNGELYAKSVMVIDPASGDTLIHLANDGMIYVGQEGKRVIISPEHVSEYNEEADSWTVIDNGGVTVSDSEQTRGAIVDRDQIAIGSAGGISGHILHADGTWEAWQGDTQVAGLDGNGELIARSFEVRDSLSGATKAHLDNDGNLALPDGAQITIGGVPIGSGGGADSIFHSEIYARSFVNTTDGTLENANGHWASDGSMHIYDTDESGHILNPDGTWEAYQGDGDVPVAGLDDTGEMFARSFEVFDQSGSTLKAHLTGLGDLNLFGSLTDGGRIETEAPHAGGTTDMGMFTPTKMCVNNMNGTTTRSGWMFYSDGTASQYVNPGGTPIQNWYTTADGYNVFGMPVFFGNQSNFNYLSGGNPTQGIMTSGNFTISGKANIVGLTDPIICEAFPVHPDYSFVPGTVVVADRNSDYIIPCDNSAQTSVIGVIAPDEKVDERGHILVTIMGYAAAFRTDGTRLEMRVKADAKYGAIHRGDLLTTSPTQGHAMLAAEPKLGTILGKALESLQSGTGEIKVMITLQ